MQMRRTMETLAQSARRSAKSQPQPFRQQCVRRMQRWHLHRQLRR